MTDMAHIAKAYPYVYIKVISHHDMMQYSKYIVNVTHIMLNEFLVYVTVAFHDRFRCNQNHFLYHCNLI